MGKQNEGVIAGSIKGAITLTENYEEVIKVLKLLIITYGTYKAAVIATAVVQKASAVAGGVQAWFQLAKGIRSAKDAQIAFNLVTKANPYVLIGTAIAALIASLVLFRKETLTTKDHIEQLNNSVESIGKQVEIDRLIDKYEELQGKTNNTKEEQKELNETIDELGIIFPSVISETNKYGKAIELSKDKLAELNDELRENARLATEKDVEDAQQKLNRLIEHRAKVLNEIKTEKGDASLDEWKMADWDLDQDEINKRRKEVQELSGDIDKLSESISKSQLKLQALGEIDAQKTLEPYKVLFAEVGKYSEEKTLEIKEELEKLLTMGFGVEATALITQQIDKIATQLALPSIKDQINQTTKDIASAQAELDRLRGPGSKATDTNISDQEKAVKELQTRLEVLTGVRKKDTDKQLKEATKAAKEKLEAAEDYAEAELNLERDIQASKIAIMKEGTQRQIAESELSHQQELDNIQKQQNEYLKIWNKKTTGAEPGDKNFVSELPEAEIEQFNQLRINAEIEKNQRVERINKDSAELIKNIWNDATDSFLTDIESEIIGINKFYDNLVEQAKKAGDLDLIPDLNAARQDATDEANIKSGLDRLAFEEDIAIRRAELESSSIGNILKVEKKKIAIYQKYAQLRINALKNSNTEAAKAEIQQLELYLEELAKGLDGIADDETAKILSSFKEIGSAVGSIDAELGSVINTLALVAENAIKAFGGFSSGGDVLGGITGAFSALAGMISLFQTDNSSTALEESLNKINHSLEVQAQLLANLNGENWFNLAIKQQGDYQTTINDTVDLLKEKGIPTLEEFNNYWENNGGVPELPNYSGFFGGETEDWDAKKFLDAYSDGLIVLNNSELELLKTIAKTQTELDNLLEVTWNKATGTTRDSVADAIYDGFRNGYNSAADFADNFEELMKTAIINSLKTKFLEGAMTEWYKGFASAAKDGLTEEEIKERQDAWNRMVELERLNYENMEKITGMDLSVGSNSSPQGLTGAIKGITEDTAGILAGLGYASLEAQQKGNMTGLQQLDMMNQSVTYLAKIADNTKHNVKLKDIDEKLGRMNDTLEKGLI